MIRLFRDVPLPRESDLVRLTPNAVARLAEDLPGLTVQLEDASGQEPRRLPHSPLGTVLKATATGDHVLAHIAIDTASFGGGEVANLIQHGELVFGLWGEGKCDPETGRWRELRPTSVRLTPRRLASRRT